MAIGRGLEEVELLAPLLVSLSQTVSTAFELGGVVCVSMCVRVFGAGAWCYSGGGSL